MTSPAAEARRVSVGIGQIAISKNPLEVLVAYGLGSCIGVSAFDTQAKVGGMVHVLLPDSAGKIPDAREPARFADTGVDLLIKRLTEAGAVPRRLIIKLAGGAAVLGPANAEKFKIGQRNAEAIKERLARHGLTPSSVDIGGTQGRTLEVFVESGKTFVRTAASPAREL